MPAMQLPLATYTISLYNGYSDLFQHKTANVQREIGAEQPTVLADGVRASEPSLNIDLRLAFGDESGKSELEFDLIYLWNIGVRQDYRSPTFSISSREYFLDLII